MHKGIDFDEEEHNNGSKVTFYFTNILDFLPLFRLRQYFEMCGILSDVYVARQLNSRGQVYGFVRFLYMRNIDKLAHALNNAWISDHRFWAREARFDRFAHHDDQNKVSIRGARGVEKGREVKLVVITHGEGVKNVRVGKVKEEIREIEG